MVNVPLTRTEPFMYQSTAWPEVLWCQRMSCRPSRSKSATPAIFQRTSVRADGVRNVPPVRTVPFMYQRTFSPETSWRQRMSGSASRLKSPVPTICQRTSASALGVVNVPPTRSTPFRNQTTFSPELVWRQRRSISPSRLKSLVPTIFQRWSARMGGFVKVPLTRFTPFMNQTTFWSETSWRQTRSGFWSPLKSPRGQTSTSFTVIVMASESVPPGWPSLTVNVTPG